MYALQPYLQLSSEYTINDISTSSQKSLRKIKVTFLIFSPKKLLQKYIQKQRVHTNL